MPGNIHRQWLMLQLVPRAPRKIDPGTIEARLRERGFAISRRSIQRDLVKLANSLPLVCDEAHKPHGWSWAKDAELLDIPSIDPNAALTLHLVREHLKPLLPPSTWESLSPQMKKAREILDRLPGGGLKGWPAKVRVIPTGQPLAPAEIPVGVVETVYESLLQNRRLAVKYRRRGETRLVGYELNPLGLVFRGGVVHLVATEAPSTDVRQFLLHRMVEASMLPTLAETLPGFDLDEYISLGNFGYRFDSRPIRLKLRLSNGYAATLAETQLSEDQSLTADGAEHQVLRATVFNTRFLHAWLLGLGDMAEVLAPASLRQEIAATTQRMASRYRRSLKR